MRRRRHIRNDARLDCYFCTTLEMLLPICATKIFCSSPQTVAGCARADLLFYGLPPSWDIHIWHKTRNACAHSLCGTAASVSDQNEIYFEIILVLLCKRGRRQQRCHLVSSASQTVKNSHN